MAKGLSLHIGVNSVDPNHYAGWSGPLNACEADADDMKDLANGRGFDSTSLLTSAATRGAVIDALRSAARTLTKGDMFFLTYSGHGGQLPDRSGDEEDDLQDETWCLYDGELLDDELYQLWGEFAEGVRVLVLSDSCHSGSVLRMALKTAIYDSTPVANATAVVAASSGQPARAAYRTMPPEVALRTYRQNKDMYAKIAAAAPSGEKDVNVKASVRLISGCQDNQLSLDGTFNGLFTGTMLQIWAGGAFKKDYAAFHGAILGRMPPTQSPNHMLVGPRDQAYDGQVPFTI